VGGTSNLLPTIQRPEINSIPLATPGSDLASSLEVIIPVFLMAILAAAFVSSRRKIPYILSY
jgi:hypothetical protein